MVSVQLDGKYADVNMRLRRTVKWMICVIVEFLEQERGDLIVTKYGRFCTLVDDFRHFIFRDCVIVI